MKNWGDRARVLKCLGFVAGIGMSWAALAADPWVSVPSTANESGLMVISGGNLGSNAAVRLRIEHPGGVVTDQQTVADAGGKLRFDYPLGTPGGYAVQVFDAGGKLLGGGRLGYIR